VLRGLLVARTGSSENVKRSSGLNQASSKPRSASSICGYTS
jgi:hypothetical protein